MPIQARTLSRLATSCLATIAIATAAQAAPVVKVTDAVIPQPAQARAGQGAFVLRPDTTVLGQGEAAAAAAQLAAALKLPLGKGTAGAIVLEMVPAASSAPKDSSAASCECSKRAASAKTSSPSSPLSPEPWTAPASRSWPPACSNA